MARIEKTVFISYRRKDISWALAVYQYLTNQNYDVFFDYTSIPSGDFEQNIVSNIRGRAHFVLVLTPTALDRCSEPGDWLRREIETAIDEHRNIIPLFFDEFSFDSPSVLEKLTGKLSAISRYNGLDVPSGYFPEAMERLNNRYLNIPLDTVLHPVSAEVQKAVRDERVAVDEELKQRGDLKELVKQAEKKPNVSKVETISPAQPQFDNHQMLDEIDNDITGVNGVQKETSVLLEELIAERYREYKTRGYSDDFLVRGLNWTIEKIDDVIREMAIPVNTLEQLASVAANSVSDKEIGELVADVLDKVGKDGVITVEESPNPYLEIEYKEGMCFDGGYLSPHFVTDVDEMEAIIDEPYILIHEGEISTIQAIVPLIEKLVKTGPRELVIITNGIFGKALDALASYKLRGELNILAVKAPDFGQYSEAILYDIAALTGGNVISDEKGNKLETATLQDLGRAEKVISDKESTTIIGGKGKNSDINRRIREINIEFERSLSDNDRLLLRKRLAKLIGGEAIIRVGAAIRAEAKAKKQRVQIALSAARAAIQAGIVPGNGVSYLVCKEKLAGTKTNYDYERTGQLILCDVLDAPIRKIANGLGLDPAMVIDQITGKRKGKRNILIGLDTKTGEYVDLVKMGVIEPASDVIHTISHAIDAAIEQATSTGVV